MRSRRERRRRNSGDTSETPPEAAPLDPVAKNLSLKAPPRPRQKGYRPSAPLTSGEAATWNEQHVSVAVAPGEPDRIPRY